MQQMLKKESVQIAGVALATAIGSGFSINPFQGDFFRIGLGVSIFLFLLLFMPQRSYLAAGLVTGLFNVLFQAGGWMLATGSDSVPDALRNNAAAGLYYVVFAVGLSLLQRKLHIYHPLLLGGLVALIDFASNEAELLLRDLLLGTNAFYLAEWEYLLLAAAVRSYFVIGLYSSLAVNEMRLLHAEQEKRLEQIVKTGAGLYGEAFYVKKSMDAIERIAENSFELHRRLKEEGQLPYSRQALGIAQQIHELKKDSQRILAGLLKLVDSETVVQMKVTEILQLVVKGNEAYAAMLQKHVTVETVVESDLTTPYYMPLLTVLNNLTANAVEALQQEGTIQIRVFREGDLLCVRVEDSGPGIEQEDRELIFEPGFTTKFNEAGIAATGIGLSHVRDTVLLFGGTLELEPAEAGGAVFTVRLPKHALLTGGQFHDAFFRYSR